jgi:hypothetical protein
MANLPTLSDGIDQPDPRNSRTQVVGAHRQAFCASVGRARRDRELVTLSEREAEELRAVAAAESGRSSARRDLSLLLDRGLRTRTTVALSRAEARELAALLTTGAFSIDLALLQEAIRTALEDAPP